MLGEFLFTVAACLAGFAILLAYAVSRRPAGPVRRVLWAAAGVVALLVWGAGYRDWGGWTAGVAIGAVADMTLPWPPPLLRGRLRRRG